VDRYTDHPGQTCSKRKGQAKEEGAVDTKFKQKYRHRASSAKQQQTIHLLLLSSLLCSTWLQFYEDHTNQDGIRISVITAQAAWDVEGFQLQLLLRNLPSSPLLFYSRLLSPAQQLSLDREPSAICLGSRSSSRRQQTGHQRHRGTARTYAGAVVSCCCPVLGLNIGKQRLLEGWKHPPIHS
jgi:hypothetical protein